MIKIDYEKCCWKNGKCSKCSCGEGGCSGCVEICPVNALKREDILEFDEKLCIGCGACASVCEQGAITLK